jgi:argininosuccinate synthase
MARGNGQVRFDMIFTYHDTGVEIHTPLIRDLQLSREAEIAYLKNKA